MPKALFVIGSLGLGGAESQLALLIDGLVQRGWHCELFALEAQGPMAKIFVQHGIVFHDGGYDSAWPSSWIKGYLLMRALFRLWWLARRSRPDVLHAFLPLTNFMGAAAGRLAGVQKVITSRRAMGTHQERRPYWRIFDRLANTFSHHVTVNSLAVGHDTVVRDGIQPSKLVHIFNGVELTRYQCKQARNQMRQTLGLGARDIGIVMVANLIPYKGHTDLLSALPSLISVEKNVRVFLVGEDRGIQSNLMRLAERLGVAQHVSFLGQRSDIPDVLGAMDIFVLASHEEGFSNALLEAMAAGLPVVVTNVGGNPEALDNGRLGILVPPKNPSALANALAQLVTDPGQRCHYGTLAEKHLRSHYSITSMVEAHISLYRR